MKRVAIVLIGLLIAISTVNAKTYTKIVLNNGSVIEGVLIEENNQIVRLEFANRDVRVFYKSDIVSLSTFEVITPEEQLVAEYTAAAIAKAEERARIAAQKETEAKSKAEERTRIAVQKEAEAKAKAEERAKITAQKEAAAIKQREKCYIQFVDLSYSYCEVTDFLGVNYIGGYRFNPYIFLGLGTGVNFSLATPDKSKLNLPFCEPTTVNVPIYIHFKANFTKFNWSPYASVSIGGRLSKTMYQNLNDGRGFYYNQSGFLGNIALGIDRKITEKLSMYLGVGYNIESFIYAEYNAYYTNYAELVHGNKLLHGFSLHLGLSF